MVSRVWSDVANRFLLKAGTERYRRFARPERAYPESPACSAHGNAYARHSEPRFAMARSLLRSDQPSLTDKVWPSWRYTDRGVPKEMKGCEVHPHNGRIDIEAVCSNRELAVRGWAVLTDRGATFVQPIDPGDVHDEPGLSLTLP